MGLKLEFLLVLFVVGILTMAMTVKIKNSQAVNQTQTVELEFTDTTSIEVDTNKTLSVTYGTYGIRDAGVLKMDNLRYHTDNIKLLRAKKGTLKGDEIYLDGDVVLNKEKGADYYTDHAVYNKKTGILLVTSPFKAIMDKNIMHGDTLRYDTKNKKAFATEVNAVVYTTEK